MGNAKWVPYVVAVLAAVLGRPAGAASYTLGSASGPTLTVADIGTGTGYVLPTPEIQASQYSDTMIGPGPVSAGWVGSVFEVVPDAASPGVTSAMAGLSVQGAIEYLSVYGYRSEPGAVDLQVRVYDLTDDPLLIAPIGATAFGGTDSSGAWWLDASGAWQWQQFEGPGPTRGPITTVDIANKDFLVQQPVLLHAGHQYAAGIFGAVDATTEYDPMRDFPYGRQAAVGANYASIRFNSVRPVPEPTSLLLLGAGASLLGAFGRGGLRTRRRRHATR